VGGHVPGAGLVLLAPPPVLVEIHRAQQFSGSLGEFAGAGVLVGGTGVRQVAAEQLVFPGALIGQPGQQVDPGALLDAERGVQAVTGTLTGPAGPVPVAAGNVQPNTGPPQRSATFTTGYRRYPCTPPPGTLAPNPTVANQSVLASGADYEAAILCWYDCHRLQAIVLAQTRLLLSMSLVGRIPPHPAQPHGRGLLRVNELCDLVEIPTGEIGTGTTVRLHMRLR